MRRWGTRDKYTWKAHKIQAKTQEDRYKKWKAIWNPKSHSALLHHRFTLASALYYRLTSVTRLYSERGDDGGGTRFHHNFCTYRAGVQPCKKNPMLSPFRPNSKFQGRNQNAQYEFGFNLLTYRGSIYELQLVRAI